MARRPATVPAPAAVAPAVPAPSWLRAVLLGLAVLLLFAFTTTEVADYDFWWHLKTGQYIVLQHKLPVPDEFAYTTYLGKPAYRGEETVRYFNLTHEWLAQIVFYLIYAAGGFTGIVLLRATLLAAFCALIGLVVYQRTGRFFRGLAAGLLAATVAYQFVPERPYLISFAFLAGTFAILESRRRLWVLPPLFLIWANCHSGFILGWAALGVYCAESLYLRLRSKPIPDERRLLLVALASVLTSGFNPNGFRVIQVMRLYQSSAMQSSVAEWQYPLPWPPTPFSVLLAAGLVILVWQRRRTRPADWLLFLIFGGASLTAVRNIILAAVAGPLVIATYVPWRRQVDRVFEFAFALLLLIATGARVAEGKSFQFRAADWKFCGRAADFLLAQNVSSRMFNTYEMGGFLIWKTWPEQRVFIDGRALNETVHRDYQRIAFNADSTNGKGAEELLNQYGIDIILMDGFDYTTGAVYLLPAALADPRQTEWKLVYRDAQALIYMRHPPAGVQPLNSLEALAALEDQCRTYVEHDPGRPACAMGLVDLFTKIGDPARAQRWRLAYAQYTE